MANITPEELHKLAAISQIALQPQDIQATAQGIEQVLTYVEMLSDVPGLNESTNSDFLPSWFNNNSIVRWNAESLLALAPQREESYFVVPVIVKQ